MLEGFVLVQQPRLDALQYLFQYKWFVLEPVDKHI